MERIGRPSSKDAMSWVGSIEMAERRRGAGKARFGGKSGPNPNGSWQDGHQEVDGRRWPGGPLGW